MYYEWDIEQGFGTLKRRFNFFRASYLTLPKVHGQMVLKAITFNLLKGLNKATFIKACPECALFKEKNLKTTENYRKEQK